MIMIMIINMINNNDNDNDNYNNCFCFLANYAKERSWWPIKGPTMEERRKQKAKRRGRSDYVY